MLPLLILSASYLSKLITFDIKTFEVTISNMIYLFIPIQFIGAMWTLAGLSYVIYNGSSHKSIRRSFHVLKSSIKPIALFTFIEFALNGLSQLTFSFQEPGILFAIQAAVPIYLTSALVIISLIYIATTLSIAKEKPTYKNHLEINCKRCDKILGYYPLEKIPPNVKGYTTCKLCGEQIEIFRKVKVAKGSAKQKYALAVALFLVFALYLSQDHINKLLLSKEEKISVLHAEGLTLFKEGNYLGAREKWLQETKLDGNVSNTWNNIGMTYTFFEEYENAIPFHERAVQINPRFGHGYYSLGRAHQFLKRFEKAKENYFLALKYNYKNADLYFSLGNIYKHSKDCESATEAYLNVIKQKNAYPWVHYYLGKCYESLKRYDSARMEYIKEGKLNTDYSVASEIAIIEMEINIDPHNVGIETYFELGEKYGNLRHTDDMNKSLDAFYNVLLLDDSYPSVHYEIGNIYKRMGRSGSSIPNFKYAIKEYEIELANNPSHKGANLGLKETTFFMKSFNLTGVKPEEKQPFDPSLYEYSDLESFKQQIDSNPVEIMEKENSHKIKVLKKKLLVPFTLPDYPKPAKEETADFLDHWVKNSKTKPDYHRFYSHELNIENAEAKITLLFNGLMIPYFKKEISKGDAVELYVNIGCYDVEENRVYLIVDEFSKKGEESAPHPYSEL